MAATARKLPPSISVPKVRLRSWAGPRAYRKQKVGRIRPLKDEGLTTYDAMLLGLQELGPATTNTLRLWATSNGLMARVGTKASQKAAGLYSHDRGLFTGIVSRLYHGYRFINEVAPQGRDLMHEINESGVAFLKNRLERFVPDTDLEEIQLKLHLNGSPQKAPPKDYSALDPARRAHAEVLVRREFDTALAKFAAIPDAVSIDHFVYMSEIGGEQPFIYRTDKFRTVIRFSEDAHPFHDVYQEYVVKARAMSASLRVTIDYAGGTGSKPFAVEIKVTRQKVALVVTSPSSPGDRGIHKNPEPVHSTKQKPTETSEADVRARPDPSRQIVMPLTLVKSGELDMADEIQILEDEMARVGKTTFIQTEARIMERFELARNQLDMVKKRQVPTNDPIECRVTLPSIDLTDPYNPYHYVAVQYYDWAKANRFEVRIEQINNGFSVVFRPIRKLLAAPTVTPTP